MTPESTLSLARFFEILPKIFDLIDYVIFRLALIGSFVFGVWQLLLVERSKLSELKRVLAFKNKSDPPRNSDSFDGQGAA